MASHDTISEIQDNESINSESLEDNEDNLLDLDSENETDTDTDNVEPELKYNPQNALQMALEATQNELKNTKDQLLRTHAEMQNIKRRSENDLEKAHKFALDRFVESLLPIIDSLERGLIIDNETSDSEEIQKNSSLTAMKEGMSLTLKLFLDTLKKFQVEPISPEGEPFDPQSHQAMSQVKSESVEPGSIIEVFQKGYMLNKRLIRPAMVIVSK
ncbi:MAG: nucleotide exchange factor GrpE [Endozoicomonadaceae bacterium]|nr:nucleotide exchange factor GrpE [Endozoicomonadaceae bacterium]